MLENVLIVGIFALCVVAVSILVLSEILIWSWCRKSAEEKDVCSTSLQNEQVPEAKLFRQWDNLLGYDGLGGEKEDER